MVEFNNLLASILGWQTAPQVKFLLYLLSYIRLVVDFLRESLGSSDFSLIYLKKLLGSNILLLGGIRKSAPHAKVLLDSILGGIVQSQGKIIEGGGA